MTDKQGSAILRSCGGSSNINGLDSSDTTKSARADKNVSACRAARRSLTLWLEQYGSEASDDLFEATFHELQWLELMPRRDYQNTPRLQAEHAEHQAKLAAAYAKWLRRDEPTCSPTPELHGWPVSSAEAPAGTEQGSGR